MADQDTEKPAVRPDVRKPIEVLHEEWGNCQKCNLGEQRLANRGQVVHGTGRPRGIYFLGESPEVYEERHGEPYIGKNGKLLRRALDHYNIRFAYISYLVACRACTLVRKPDGSPDHFPERNGRPGGLKFVKQQPTTLQINTCAPRVYEEIYINDPIVIVAMGQTAASFLAKSSVNVKKFHGAPIEIEIPGAGYQAVLSEKKREWLRKIHGEQKAPTKQNMVRYLMIPTFDLSLANDQSHNTEKDSLFRLFLYDILLAKKIYDRYNEESSGVIPEDYELDVPESIIAEMNAEEADG